MRRLFLCLFFSLCTLSLVFAQEDVCAETVRAAIDSTLQHCANMGVNEVCYGNGTQEIAARGDSEALYSEPGGVVETGVVDVLALSSDDEALSIALLTPRANFVDGYLNMVALGNVSLQNLGSARSDFVAAPVTVSRRNGAQIYSQPNTPTDEYLFWGEVVRAVGRSADENWLLVLREDDTSAWIFATDIDADFAFALLPIVEPNENIQPPYAGSLQTLTLISGESACAVESGLIVQSPDLERKGFLNVNNLDIQFTGTLFLQAQPGESLIVSVLNGEALLGADEDLFTLHEGERLLYPFNGETLGEHGLPEPYHYVAARNLPLFYLLPRTVELPFSTGGLLTTYADGDLARIDAQVPCTIAWTVAINLRAGPGTGYAIRQGVEANFRATPDARAVGTDGVLWWRLAEGIWLSSENTLAAGTCGTLSMVEDPENDR